MMKSRQMEGLRPVRPGSRWQLWRFLATLLLLGLPALAGTGGARESLVPGKPAEEPQPKKEPILTLTGHTSEVYSVTFSPNGKLLASGSNTQVKVWDATTGKEVFTYPIRGTNVFGLAFRPDGKQLAVGISRVVKLLDTADGTELASLNAGPNFLFRLAFSPDGKQLAASAGSTRNLGEVWVWDAVMRQPVFCLTGPAEAVLTVAYSADGRLLASAGGGTTGSKPGSVVLWEKDTGRKLLTLAGHPDTVYGLAFSPAGRRLVSGGGAGRGRNKPGTLKLWEVATGQEVSQLTGHAGPIFGVAFSPDGRRLATASGDRTLRLWDALTGQETLSIPAHSGTIYSLAYSPDGRRLASAGQDRLIKVWDVSGPARLGRTLKALRTPREIEALFTDLSAAEAGRAYRSLEPLVAAPELTVALLRSRMRPVSRLNAAQEKQVVRWLHELRR